MAAEVIFTRASIHFVFAQYFACVLRVFSPHDQAHRAHDLGAPAARIISHDDRIDVVRCQYLARELGFVAIAEGGYDFGVHNTRSLAANWARE
jgi:hypothetical protein